MPDTKTDVIRCRVRRSDACYHGRPAGVLYRFGGIEIDGTWDGETVVCDACYRELEAIRAAARERERAVRAEQRADSLTEALQEICGEIYRWQTGDGPPCTASQFIEVLRRIAKGGLDAEGAAATQGGSDDE